MAKCPVCGKNKSNKQDLINHVETDHINEIPENMSTAQFIYFKTHGREYGLCRICGKPTPWNEKTGKPQQHCGSDACKAKIKEIARQRMIKIYGKESLMNDIKLQEKLLANRKISGTYIWSDKKHKFTYTGKYEKFAIEWLDKVMDLDPENIQMPGPVLPYEYNGEIKYWITDIYLTDFNLIIEIKAGKDENTHPGFEHNRELEEAKDKSMLKQNVYNYTKITHKSMMNLIKILAEIRMNNLFSETVKKESEPIILINESSGNINFPIYPEITPIINICKDDGAKISYRKFNEVWKDSRHANGLTDPDELFEVSYDSEKDMKVNELLVSNGYICYEKPRSSKLMYAKYRLASSNSSYKIDVFVDYIRKTVTFTIFRIDKNPSLTNEDVNSICESIMNEYTMSISNISPIMTGTKFSDKDNNSLLDRLKKIKEKVKQEVIEPTTSQDNIFSPNNTQPAPNPLDSSDNFVENEEIRVDIESDPYNTKPNDFADISQSNIKSYF